MAERTSAAQQAIGDIAPHLADLTDDVLFGDVWERSGLSKRDRSLVTVSALVALYRSEQLDFHLPYAMDNGLTEAELVEALTHLAFYAGWPNAMDALGRLKALRRDDHGVGAPRAMDIDPIFPRGGTNDAYAQHFVGQSYLAMLPTKGVVIGNVTFEPGCRNDWHIHQASAGGGQILLATAGSGWHQIEGQAPERMEPGTVAQVPPGVKHWHGATRDSWFTHLAIEVPGEGARTEWLEPVTDEAYDEIHQDGATS